MGVPFSRDQFFDVFARYNQGVWPAQFVLFALAVSCVAMILDGRGWSRAIGATLGLLWAWTAFAYHVRYFTAINPAAWVFAAGCAAAAGAFLWYARSGALAFDRPRGVAGVAGMVLVLYALVGYPLIGMLAGEAYPRVPTFGLPCPTTIFTLGVLLFARRPFPVGVAVVPFAWSVIGSTAAVAFGVVQDFGLFAAGAIAAAAFMHRDERPFSSVR